MEGWKLVLIVVLIIAIGFLLYKFLPFDYTPNVVPFWDNSFEEIDLIQKELDDLNTTEDRKKELMDRQNEIKVLLNKFFGNELV